jgi:hypothetical protein
MARIHEKSRRSDNHDGLSVLGCPAIQAGIPYRLVNTAKIQEESRMYANMA